MLYLIVRSLSVWPEFDVVRQCLVLLRQILMDRTYQWILCRNGERALAYGSTAIIFGIVPCHVALPFTHAVVGQPGDDKPPGKTGLTDFLRVALWAGVNA
jgi:hypothetical protein